MSRPYQKNRGGGGGGGSWGGSGGGSGRDSNSNNRSGGGGGRGGRSNQSGCGGRGGGGRSNNDRGGNRQGGGGGGGGGGSYISNNNAGGGGGIEVMKTLLKLVLEKNQAFDVTTGMLSLPNMRGATDLQAVAKSVDFNSTSFCKSLAESLRDHYGQNVRVIVLDNNDIRKLGIFFSALIDADLHLGITAISAANNTIADLGFLPTLKRFPAVSELLIRDNPVTLTVGYGSQISRMLPGLIGLDGEPIQRNMLGLPNPIAPFRDGALLGHGDTLTSFINDYLLQPLTLGPTAAQALAERVPAGYASSTCSLSLSRGGPNPIPNRLQFNAAHNNADLDQGMKTAMQTDMGAVRQGLRFRNLAGEVSSMREMAHGQQEIIRKLKDYAGCGKHSVSVQVAANPTYNIAVIEQNMKVPVIIVTIHGKLRYLWNPNPGNSASSAGIFQQGKEPFVSTFFDRTISFVWVDNRFQIVNDMIHCRPDSIVMHEGGAPSGELFAVGNPDRIEQMRRRLLPAASHEVMKYIIFNAGSDRAVQEASAFCAAALTPEQLQSLEAVTALWQSQQQQRPQSTAAAPVPAQG